ncbi:LOW QUALITY PROTEIN: hypothetical protein TorRG33x02_302170 [Trema orientale]|uniref:Uncharacterized protein n=1 Tax=Trema orientale TaxID=63057 RepID=A0A2P5C0L0_TREOI|nr:LOW QUALITY PROTEIN: hypothetical protein TorRG33x02_302170 [Trema orientale]
MKLLESLRRAKLSCRKKRKSYLSLSANMRYQLKKGLKTSHAKEIEDACQVAVNEAIETWFREFSTSDIHGSRSFKDEVKSRYPEIDLSIYDLEEDSASAVGTPRSPIEALHDDEVGLQQDQAVIDGVATERDYTRVEDVPGGPTTDVAGTSQEG